MACIRSEKDTEEENKRERKKGQMNKRKREEKQKGRRKRWGREKGRIETREGENVREKDIDRKSE